VWRYSLVKCKRSPVYRVFSPLLPHPSTDRNETRTWSSLSPRNLPIKFGTNPSTIVLVIVITDRQGYKAELTGVAGYTEVVCQPKTVTHPSSNQTRCRVTSLIRANTLSTPIPLLLSNLPTATNTLQCREHK